jgi:glycosyltransferase involved in cell wall biosynthesis
MAHGVRVVLTAYNQLPFLRRVLPGYLRQTTPDFALTIADDGSSDGTQAYLEELAPAFAERGIGFDHVWHADEGWRKCHILNEAVRRAPDARLLIFSDGDCIPPARFVERHAAVHVPRSFHVGGGIRLSQEVSEAITVEDVESGRFESLATPADLRDARRRWRKTFWGTLRRRVRRPKILGLNFALDRELLEAVNGFDEAFLSYALEDSDLRDRLMRLRPRPVVRNLYGKNDVFHLWHPSSNPREGRKSQWAYYQQARPVFCEQGLARSPSPRT